MHVVVADQLPSSALDLLRAVPGWTIDARTGRTPLDLAKGIGVPGVRQAAGEPFPETVALIESLLAAR